MRQKEREINSLGLDRIVNGSMFASLVGLGALLAWEIDLIKDKLITLVIYPLPSSQVSIR